MPFRKEAIESRGKEIEFPVIRFHKKYTTTSIIFSVLTLISICLCMFIDLPLSTTGSAILNKETGDRSDSLAQLNDNTRDVMVVFPETMSNRLSPGHIIKFMPAEGFRNRTWFHGAVTSIDTSPKSIPTLLSASSEGRVLPPNHSSIALAVVNLPNAEYQQLAEFAKDSKNRILAVKLRLHNRPLWKWLFEN